MVRDGHSAREKNKIKSKNNSPSLCLGTGRRSAEGREERYAGEGVVELACTLYYNRSLPQITNNMLLCAFGSSFFFPLVFITFCAGRICPEGFRPAHGGEAPGHICIRYASRSLPRGGAPKRHPRAVNESQDGIHREDTFRFRRFLHSNYEQVPDSLGRHHSGVL